MRYADAVKILFTRFPLESRYGGAEVQTRSLMKGLMEHGHAVAFLGSCPTLLRLCREEGIASAELQIGPPPVTKWGALSFVWRKNAMRQQLTDAFDQIHPDIVCMLSLSEKLLLTDHAAAKGARVLWIEHDRIGRWLTQNPWLNTLLRLAPLALTVGVSHLSRKMYLELGWPQERTIAIANGIDATKLKTQDSGSKTQGNHRSPNTKYGIRRPLHIGTIARLSREKGVDLLIEALAGLPDCHLTVVGEGREEKKLRALAESKHVGDRTIIQPRVEDLGTFYRALDLFVLPSREHDPFGLVAAEAMMCGVATVVTDACGIAGYLKNGTDAMIVPALDPHALARCIVQLSDPVLRGTIAANGRKTAEEKFRTKRMVEEYELLFTGNSSRWK